MPKRHLWQRPLIALWNRAVRFCAGHGLSSPIEIRIEIPIGIPAALRLAMQRALRAAIRAANRAAIRAANKAAIQAKIPAAAARSPHPCLRIAAAKLLAAPR
jgi:hypothetical protein